MAFPLSAWHSPARQHHLAIIALVLMCAIWGSTFALLKTLTNSLSALDITLLRYGGAGLLLLCFVRGIRPPEWRWGLIYGVTLFSAFYLQTEGIARTSANRNAFITGLNVLAVPILARGLGQRPGWRLFFACALAGLGMYYLFYAGAPWNMGDSLTAVAMLCYAVYILLLEVSAQRHTAQQTSAVGVGRAGHVSPPARAGWPDSRRRPVRRGRHPRRRRPVHAPLRGPDPPPRWR